MVTIAQVSILVKSRDKLPSAAANQILGRSSTRFGWFLGRISTSAMPNESSDRIQLPRETLDMLILRTLLFGPAHRHQIARLDRENSVLQANRGCTETTRRGRVEVEEAHRRGCRDHAPGRHD